MVALYHVRVSVGFLCCKVIEANPESLETFLTNTGVSDQDFEFVKIHFQILSNPLKV